MNRKQTVFACALGAVLLASGCAQQVPLDDLSAGPAYVGVVVTMVDGEELRGELLSVTEREMVVIARYAESHGVEIEALGDDRRVVVNGTRVAGEVVGVDLLDGARVARVRRAIRVQDIDRATFHRSAQEASLAATLSLLLGPSVGGLLALVM